MTTETLSPVKDIEADTKAPSVDDAPQKAIEAGGKFGITATVPDVEASDKTPDSPMADEEEIIYRSGDWNGEEGGGDNLRIPPYINKNNEVKK